MTTTKPTPLYFSMRAMVSTEPEMAAAQRLDTRMYMVLTDT